MLKTEFIKKIRDCLNPSDKNCDISILNYLPSEGTLRIELSREYEAVTISFAVLEKIAAVSETQKINLGEVDGDPGCKSCDFGSCYTVPLFLKDFRIPLEDSIPSSS